MAGDPKFMGSQYIPDVPYAQFAELLGLKGIRCDDPTRIGTCWDEALAADRPVVLEAAVSQEVPPIPPHIVWEQAKKSAKAVLKEDPEAAGIVKQGVKQKLHEFTEAIKEKLPGGES